MQAPIECGWLASRARHWFGRDAEHRPRGRGWCRAPQHQGLTSVADTLVPQVAETFGVHETTIYRCLSATEAAA